MATTFSAVAQFVISQPININTNLLFVFVVLGMKLFVFLAFSSAVAVAEMECFFAHGQKEGFILNQGVNFVSANVVYASAPNFFNEVTSKEYSIDMKSLWYNVRYLKSDSTTRRTAEYDAVIEVYHAPNTAPRKYHIHGESISKHSELEFDDVFRDCT